ncbi:MAG: DUF4091 domain-containing protein [Phycisphaerales bacterium]|nr:DUF4091 domain-containing protein [Phycisphaerales bacterium]
MRNAFKGSSGVLALWLAILPGTAWGLGLRNTNFAEVRSGLFADWHAHPTYMVDGHTAYMHCPSPEHFRGLMQAIRCDPPIIAPFIASARAKGVIEGDAGDFSVWVDLIHDDGSFSYRHAAHFDRRTEEWQEASVEIVPSKPVVEIQFFLLLRHTKGEAWFAQPRLQFTPVTFRRLEAVSGLWQAGSLSIRAETNMPATITMAGFKERTGTKTTQEPSALTVEIPDIGHPRKVRHVILEARSAFDESNRARVRLDVTAVPRTKPPVNWRAWMTDALTRVFIDTLPPTHSPGGTPAEPITIDAVRNGHADIQIAVAANPHDSDQHVEVTIGDLTGEAGTLSGELWQRFRVGFVRNEQPPQHPFLERPGPTWWPDPLLTWQPLAIPPGQTRSAILTVHVPAGQAAGLYEGHVTVSQTGGQEQRLPVRLKVHDVTLGNHPRIKNAFALMDGFLEKVYGRITPELRRAYTAFVLKHRLNPDDISRTRLPDLEELVWAKERGLTTFNILNLVPEPRHGEDWVCYASLQAYTPEFKQRVIERLDAFVPELEKRGLLDMAYVYGFDERGPEYIPVIQEYFGLIKQRYPRLRTLSTCWPPADTDPASLAIDWYCPLSNLYDLEAAERHRARGGEMWWYICLGPIWPYANWMLEYPLIESRLLWWQTWQHKVDGLLYWGLNIWNRPHNDAPIPDDADAMLKWSVTQASAPNGDGILLYPGTAGPLGSLRLLGIRAGIEDTMLMDIAEARLGRDMVEQCVQKVTSGLTDFTRDPAVLHTARRAILSKLEKGN